MRTALLLIAALAGELFAFSPVQGQGQRSNELSQDGVKPPAQIGFLGVGVTDVDPDRVSRLKLNEERGVEVTRVGEDSPADKAGIEPGDVILSYSGENVLSSPQFVRLVRETPPGRKVKLQLWRNEKTHIIWVTVGVAPAQEFRIPAHFTDFTVPGMRYPPMMDIPMPILVWRNTVLGALLEELDKPMAHYFGVKGGMLVRSVDAGSPAERAGLKAGDVITSIGSSPVLSARDLTSYFRSPQHRFDNPTPIVAMRDHKEVTVSIAPLESRR